MTRTQIQLPNALYAQAKRIAERQEISLAELYVHTLLDRGVKELATRNTRDFENFGFERVFDLLMTSS